MLTVGVDFVSELSREIEEMDYRVASHGCVAACGRHVHFVSANLRKDLFYVHVVIDLTEAGVKIECKSLETTMLLMPEVTAKGSYCNRQSLIYTANVKHK